MQGDYQGNDELNNRNKLYAKILVILMFINIFSFISAIVFWVNLLT